MMWVRLSTEGLRSSAEQRAELEARVAANPDDVEARVKLVGALRLVEPEHQKRRGAHLVWLATNRPDIGLGSFATLSEEHAPDENAALHAAWRAAIANPDVSVGILDNAASCLGVGAPAEAEAIYRRAVALEPGSPRWRERLAKTLLRQDRPLEAIAELEAALDRADVDWIQLGICLELLEAVSTAKQWDRATELAQRILEDNETVTRTFQYGNAIHKANIALGWAAHARGDFGEAGFFLQRAGKTPGSPQLDSFGPDRELAAALLSAGERAAVRAYFEDCLRFWKLHRGRLDEAIAAIDRGAAELP